MLLEWSCVVWLWPQRSVNKCQNRYEPLMQSLFVPIMPQGSSLCNACWVQHRLIGKSPVTFLLPFILTVVVGWCIHPAKTFPLCRLLSQPQNWSPQLLSDGSSIPNFGAPFLTPGMQLLHSILTSHLPWLSLNLSLERKHGVAQHCVPRVSRAGGAHIIFVE